MYKRQLLIVLSALAFWRLALRMARRERLDLAPATDLAAVYLLAMTLGAAPVSYTHLRAHETVLDLVCRLLLEKKKDIIN